MADALRAEGAEVTFVGGDRAEVELVPAAGYELRRLRVVPLPRKRPAQAVRAGGVAAAAVREARRIVKELRPAAILGGGGYVAGPVGLSAVLSRVPLVLTEADSHLGLTNRMLAPFARRVCLAFPIEGLDGARYLVTGRPVPAPATDRPAARARFGIGLSESCVLVFGGSQGARSINRAAVEAFAGARFHVLHAAGERDLRDLEDLQAPGPHYDLRGYIPRFGEALLASDLVVARAGGSIFEIAAHGKPAILVPYPYATADHQTGERELHGARRRGGGDPGQRADGRPAGERGWAAARGSGAADGDGAGLGRAGTSGRGARHRARAARGGADALTRYPCLGSSLRRRNTRPRSSRPSRFRARSARFV